MNLLPREDDELVRLGDVCNFPVPFLELNFKKWYLLLQISTEDSFFNFQSSTRTSIPSCWMMGGEWILSGPSCDFPSPRRIMTSKANVVYHLFFFNPSRDHGHLWAGCQSNPADVDDLPKNWDPQQFQIIFFLVWSCKCKSKARFFCNWGNWLMNDQQNPKHFPLFSQRVTGLNRGNFFQDNRIRVMPKEKFKQTELLVTINQHQQSDEMGSHLISRDKLVKAFQLYLFV